jgi:hypothetical protein
MRLVLLTVIASIVAIAQPQPQQPESRQPVRIEVNDPRPLAGAAEALERRLGWVVTYEDPEWAAGSEIQDVTETVRTDLAGVPASLRSAVPRVYVPKAGSIHLEISPSAAIATGADRINLLSDLLAAHSSAGNPGTFRVQEGTSGRIHIVPLAARDSSEHVVPQQPVLDRGITLESRQYRGLEFLAAFLEAVTRASGVQVEIGATPINTLVHHSGTYSASNEPARNVLARFLDSVGPGYSWQLFYDPVDHAYFLNIHSVPSKGGEE